MSGGVRIRPEEPVDRAAIRTVHERAFGSSAEADLVDRLRADGDLVLSLVAALDHPIGHVAYSRLVLTGSPARAVALAPVAVLPEFQRTGVGTALIRESLSGLATAGEDLVLVLGEPAFYDRFGFTVEGAKGLATPYDGPYLQALALSEPGRAPAGRVVYAPAFADLA